MAESGDKYGIDATTKLPVVIHPDKSTTSLDGKGGEVVRDADGLTTSVKSRMVPRLLTHMKVVRLLVVLLSILVVMSPSNSSLPPPVLSL
ncbi:MAG: hypothetical protein IPL73_20315 [Candidatus Obscuribacter sp.]|nr:hypothetical protein [Candidatus Obscuribacter sp.]